MIDIVKDIKNKLGFDVVGLNLKSEIQECVVNSTHSFIIMQFCTRAGKSRPALQLCSTGKSLCFTPTQLLHNNHKLEAAKWNIDVTQLEFACYASSHKYVDTEYEVLWLDECHAVTENNISNIAQIKAKRIICTSATIPDEKMKLLYQLGKPKIYTITTLMGIQWGLISKPKIYVIDKPLSPFVNHIYEKGKDKNKKFVTCTFAEYQKTYKWMKSAKRPNLKINCNEVEYYQLLGEEFDKLTWAYKQKDADRGRIEMQRKLLGNKRKQWLNSIKTLYAIELCKKLRLKGQRFIVFTNDINQCGLIAQGKTQIHSDNPSKDDEQSIIDFNNKTINELYAVSKMDAGLTLYDFDAAIHVSLSGSAIQSTQRTGRSLASDFPIVYVIRVPNTKDAEFFEGLKNELPSECFNFITLKDI